MLQLLGLKKAPPPMKFSLLGSMKNLPVGAKSIADEMLLEDALILELNGTEHHANQSFTGKALLQMGRQFACLQAVVMSVKTLLRSKTFTGWTILKVAFWLTYSAYGFFMFTPRAGLGRSGIGGIVPKLAIYTILATVLVSVYTARSFAAFDRAAAAIALQQADRDMAMIDALSSAIAEAPEPLGAVFQAIVLSLPIYCALGAYTRLQVEALWLHVKMDEARAAAEPEPEEPSSSSSPTMKPPTHPTLTRTTPRAAP